jgi:putative methyltransferase (TIGR04325 family)
MIKDLLPPILTRFITSVMYGWSGDYSSWKIAEGKCSGYDSDIIIKKVKESLLKVKNGEAVFERDSVIFDKVQYSFPLLSALSIIALKENQKLNLLDFGGSLGSSYFQNRNVFQNLLEFKWNIVEQKHFVEEGKKTFEDEHLKFYFDINTCLDNENINVFLLGSVLQYIEKKNELLNNILSKKIKYIVIDRTPVFKNNKDRITIQKVPKSIYEAQYPSWIMNEDKLVNQITDSGYELVFDSESNENLNLNDAFFKGYFFKLKE